MFGFRLRTLSCLPASQTAMERADAQRRRQRYATDPEYRRREVERVRKWKLKNEFREWQRKYNSEYYRKIGKEKM